MNQAQRIGNEIYREAMRVSICDLCRKVCMYTVTVNNKMVCEWCADAAWQEVAEDRRELEDQRRAAQNGTL